MRVLAAVDLDGTVVFSRRTPDGTLREEPAPGLAALATACDLVPVTTRTPEQYGRLALPGPPSLAVCANGAVLLRSGAPDPEWAGWAAGVCAAAAPLAEIEARVGAGLDAGWAKTWRTAAGSFVYVVAHERAAIPAGWLAGLEPWLDDRGWRLSVQGRKVYAVPAGLTKDAAITRLRAELGDPPLLAAGDALLDAGLLTLGAASAGAIRPAHGELHDRGWSLPGVAVTVASGPPAGAEILAWLLTRSSR